MILRLLKLCISLFVLSVSLANAQVPDGFMSYDQRPDILKITPKDHASLPQSWQAMKRGHLEAVAQVLELYPDHELYFLARDSELLYDFAKLATVDEPSYAKRIHLLNVSRSNMRAENIKAYLAQEGISESALKSGKKVLFVDTGFAGTIPRVIEEYFPKNMRSSFQTHLLSSANASHPSTRTFLRSLNPAAADVLPSSLHGSIISYELMPRFTDRSDRFVQVDGKWLPVSNTSTSSDGAVDPKKAQKYQESIAEYQKSKEGKALFQERRKTYRKLFQVKDDSKALKKELQTLLRKGESDPYNKALVIDFLETERIQHGKQVVSPEDLGITLPVDHFSYVSNKNELIHLYPQWAPILENPESKVLELVNAQDYATLGAINDVIRDDEYFYLFTRNLGATKRITGQEAALIEALIKHGKADLYLIKNILWREGWEKYPQLVEAIIRSGKADAVVATYIFSEPYWKEHPELVKALIKNGNADQEIAKHVLSAEHWKGHPELVEQLIKNGNADAEKYISYYLFADSHWKSHPRFTQLCPQGVTLECLKSKLQKSNTHVSTPCSASQVLKAIIH